jgi:hypothetical protein
LRSCGVWGALSDLRASERAERQRWAQRIENAAKFQKGSGPPQILKALHQPVQSRLTGPCADRLRRQPPRKIATAVIKLILSLSET